MMTHSMYNADRTTHMQIVVVALVAAIGISVAGISARLSADDFQLAASAPVMEAGGPVQMSVVETGLIR